MIDYERNLVVARGTPEQLDVMEKIIKEFDRPVQQVLIEARFVTLSKPAFMQLGVLWQSGTTTPSGVPTDFTGGGAGAGLLNSGNFPQAITPSGSFAPAIGLGIQNVFTNIIHGSDLSATISALEQSGESQTLSAPRLTVLNNRPATISDGQVQYYYEEYAVATTVGQYYTASSWVPSGKPTKITAGAELNVMASISGDGKSILLALNPKVNTGVQLVPYATLTQPNSQRLEFHLHHQPPAIPHPGNLHPRRRQVRRNRRDGRGAGAGENHLCRVGAGPGRHSDSGRAVPAPHRIRHAALPA